MISDQKLAKISLTIAILGIVSIYLVTLFAGPEPREIGTLSDKDAGRHVIVNATILLKTAKDGNFFFTLTDDTGNITAVLFERDARSQQPNAIVDGDRVVATGQVNIYKNELEIIVERIWKS